MVCRVLVPEEELDRRMTEVCRLVVREAQRLDAMEKVEAQRSQRQEMEQEAQETAQLEQVTAAPQIVPEAEDLPPPPQGYTVAEFAAEIGASVPTIVHMVLDGLLQKHGVEGEWCIPFSELDRFRKGGG